MAANRFPPERSAAPARGVRGPAVGLLLSCHPAPSVAVTVVSVLLSIGVGLRGGTVALIGAAVLTGQLSIGWSNDRLDARRDAHSARSDKPASDGRVPLPVLTVAAATALLLTVMLSVAVGGAAAVALLALVAAGWAYNLGLKATIWSGPAYVVGFGALPAAPYLAAGDAVPWWVPPTGALLGLGAHVTNVLPDLKDDAATGVRGLPHRLGLRASTLLLAVCLGAAAILLAVGPSRPVALAAVAASVGVLAAAAIAVVAQRWPDSPAAFRLTMALAVFDVVLALSLAT